MPLKSTITEEKRNYRHVDGSSLAYRLLRNTNRRRTLTMRLRGGTLVVAAPKKASVRLVEDFIARNWDLIHEWLEAYAGRLEKETDTLKRVFSHGVIPYLGRELPFTVQAGRGGYRLTDEGLVLFTSGELPEEVRVLPLLGKWYKAHAKAVFAKALEERIALSGLPDDYRRLTLRVSSAKTRWGSCSWQRTISLNWRLLFYDPKFLDYVLCHELAHLKEMNHSARFWRQVEAYCPNFREVRGELKNLRLDSSPFE